MKKSIVKVTKGCVVMTGEEARKILCKAAGAPVTATVNAVGYGGGGNEYIELSRKDSGIEIDW